MNFGRISCAVILLATAGSGCISIPMDDTDQYRDIGKQNCWQVTSLSVDRIEPKIVCNDLAGYKLVLYAVGKFIKHDGYQTERANIGRRTLTIGLWPGMAVDRDDKGAIAFLSFLMNGAFVGLPTLSSLLAEPFSDYSYSLFGMSNNFSFADVGLIGCRKHYSGGNKTRTLTGFQETDCKNCSRVSVYGFSVAVNGKQYKTESDGSVLLRGIISGERIRVKIVEAPSVNNDSTDKMTELVGTEFDLVVP